MKNKKPSGKTYTPIVGALNVGFNEKGHLIKKPSGKKVFKAGEDLKENRPVYLKNDKVYHIYSKSEAKKLISQGQTGTCQHQFWKDRNPPQCLNCGKTEEELRKEKEKPKECKHEWRKISGSKRVYCTLCDKDYTEPVESRDESLRDGVINHEKHIIKLEKKIENLYKWAESTDDVQTGHWANINRIDKNIIELEAKIENLTKKKK